MTKKIFSTAGMTDPIDVIVSLVSVTFGIGVDENLTLCVAIASVLPEAETLSVTVNSLTEELIE